MYVYGDVRNILDLIQDKFESIIIDPPWPYDNRIDRVHGGYIYNPLSIEEIFSIPLKKLSAKNSVIYEWCTWPTINYGVYCLKYWGFILKTGFSWIKTTEKWYLQCRNGYWIFGTSEPILVGTKGKMSPPHGSDRYLGLLGPSFEHSKKPQSIHDMIESNKNVQLDRDWETFYLMYQLR